MQSEPSSPPTFPKILSTPPKESREKPSSSQIKYNMKKEFNMKTIFSSSRKLPSSFEGMLLNNESLPSINQEKDNSINLNNSILPVEEAEETFEEDHHLDLSSISEGLNDYCSCDSDSSDDSSLNEWAEYSGLLDETFSSMLDLMSRPSHANSAHQNIIAKYSEPSISPHSTSETK